MLLRHAAAAADDARAAAVALRDFTICRQACAYALRDAQEIMRRQDERRLRNAVTAPL